MPHFEEEPPVAKTYTSVKATPLSPTGTQFCAPIFVAHHADRATESNVIPSSANLSGEIVEQFSNLQVRRDFKTQLVKKATNRNVENFENFTARVKHLKNYDDSIQSEPDVSTSDSDEGYDSEATVTIPKRLLLGLPILAATPTIKVKTAPDFDLTHTLTTCPKTQHFAKTLTVHALHPTNALEAGQIIARYVNLPFLKASLFPAKSKGKAKVKLNSNSKANFYTSIEELNSCNSDGLAFAKALFCPRGQLLGKHQSSATQYLGPWGAELEGSPVLVVKYLFVSRSFRRQGIARLLLASLIAEMEARMTRNGSKGKVEHVVVFPAVIKEDFATELEGKTEEEKKEVEEREYRNAVGAYRALGFRRIGLSKWFALAIGEGHVSRGLAVDDDLDEDEDEN